MKKTETNENVENNKL